MSQSKVLRQFLGLVDDFTPQSILKELFKRRRDEHYEKLELEASSIAKENIQEDTLWIEKTSSSISDESAPSNFRQALADSPLSHITESVSSMAMYLENKIGYPHLKKVLNSLKDHEDDEDNDKTTQEQLKPTVNHLDEHFSDEEDDGDDQNSIDSEDILWLGTGESLSHKYSISKPDGLGSPDKLSSYREKITDNMKRRSEYRESVLLQYSGLNDEPESDESQSSLHGSTSQSISEEVSATSEQKISKLSEPKTIIRRAWSYFMSLLQSLSATHSIISIEIIPIIILAVVVYFVSRSEINKETVK